MSDTIHVLYAYDLGPYVVAIFTDEITCLRYLAQHSAEGLHYHSMADGEFKP
jgi:hypothetical protein